MRKIVKRVQQPTRPLPPPPVQRSAAVPVAVAKREVWLDEAQLAKILADQRFKVAFPVLAALSPVMVRTCCGGQKKAVDLSAAKQAILGLSVADRARFKKLLNAGTVTLYLRDGQNKVQEHVL